MAMRITDETLMGTFEQKRELVRSFTMFDDDFFAVVMEDKAAAQEVLRVLTEIPDLIVKSVKTQYSIRNLGTHSVILDASAEDSEHKLYNLELQVANQDDHQKRGGITNPILIFLSWIKERIMRSCRNCT